ncbi:hypothetical protein [Ideonella sp. A 288]|uniref:hypothetical protein n=1 Tax=Ideonella sp. A 288 TaxID=1962181 RepID=UPI001F4007B7|nr:hypothetical protein [Ideonella sp. A 288]
MAGSQRPSPIGSDRSDAWFDNGTMCLARSPAPGGTGTLRDDRALFESAVQALEAQIANAGAHLTIDQAARQAYMRQTRAMADDLRAQALAGRLTWAEAATQANETRNVIMQVIRDWTTSVGRAKAEQIKRQGRTLNEMIARKAQELFGKNIDFNTLTAAQKDEVYAAIVRSAGKADPTVSAKVARLSRLGRGLLVLSIGLSIYSVATADDKLAAAGREAAVTGAGIGGGILGGAAAGLMCGPGAPVCVTVGAFVGGALAAFGVDFFW